MLLQKNVSSIQPCPIFCTPFHPACKYIAMIGRCRFTRSVLMVALGSFGHWSHLLPGSFELEDAVFSLRKQQLGLVAGGVDFSYFYQWLHGCWAKTSRAMSGSWWFCLRWWQQRREDRFGRHKSSLCYDGLLGQTVVRMKGFWSEPLVSTTCWIHEAPTIPYDHCGSEGQIYPLILAVSAKTQSTSRGTTENLSETYPVSRKNTTKKETRSKYKEGK